MAPKSAPTQLCQICCRQPSKYRCSNCPVRYCSVPCYKQHKLTCGTENATQPPPSSEPLPSLTSDIPSSSSLTDAIPLPSDDAQDTTVTDPSGTEEPPKPLRPLTSLSWPPEPEESIFTDPLKREDPKPLRREELLRITTSSSLRTLLNTTSLPSILRLLDSLPPSARHSMLSRLLGLDPQTLSQPAGSTASFLSGRDSPPPLDELLNTIVAARSTSSGTGTGTGTGTGNEDGWWLRGSGGEKIWIGEEEKKIMRLFAGSVCTAIDGKADGEGEIAWGQGGLEWEV